MDGLSDVSHNRRHSLNELRSNETLVRLSITEIVSFGPVVRILKACILHLREIVPPYKSRVVSQTPPHDQLTTYPHYVRSSHREPMAQEQESRKVQFELYDLK